MSYPFQQIEQKWQKYWVDQKLFEVDTADTRNKFYCLMMFPYPSAALHVGHGRNYIIGDVVVRYKKMNGFNVLTPMGWDAFGLPAENAAIKGGIHPKISTLNNVANMKRQLKSWGVCYDWKREVTACLPDYYQWTQWIFLKLFEKGLAYKKLGGVNWCPSCQTVLANEQVIDGSCERCDAKVIDKDLEQWFFKITDYAQTLLDDLESLKGWPERVKTMQKNWIGRSDGVNIDFPIDGENDKLPCFTTRVDTIFGATYMVLAPEHPRIDSLIRGAKNEPEIRKLIARIRTQSKTDRAATETEKEGIFTGRSVINPVNGQKIPLWIANYVLMEYGTGAVMAVPAHDQRDFEFAKKYGLAVKEVIQQIPSPQPPPVEGGGEVGKELQAAYEDDGVLVNSGEFDGLPNREAMQKIADWMEQKGIGKRSVHYRLRDWLISRQRYWGAPIPIIYCSDCGTIPVAEKDLPVLLPEDVEFRPKGESPLARVPSFVQTQCPKCGKSARRETDTMDTFVDSSWYYLRYISPKEAQRPFDSEAVNRWLPVDQYIGGVEHAILHLLYSRFITKVLCDGGFIKFREPFANLFTQGMIVKDGTKMSKSRGNTVSPDELISKYGADTVRLYTLFIGPPEKDVEWNDRGVEGAWRFLSRVWRLLDSVQRSQPEADPPSAEAYSVQERQKNQNSELETRNPKLNSLRRKTHQTIQRVTEDIEEEFHFNTAISAIMELVNAIYDSIDPAPSTQHPAPDSTVLREAVETVVLLLHPFVPHISEEMWQRLKTESGEWEMPAGGGSASGGESESLLQQPWPQYDPAIAKEEEVSLVIQINGKVRSRLDVPAGLDQEEIKKRALQDGKVREWLGGNTVKKIIVVGDRLVNIVF